MKIILFGGTSEGRELAEVLDRRPGVELDIYTATDYGAGMLRDIASPVHTGRLDAQAMRQLFEKDDPRVVIDATHPHAAEVSKNIRQALTDLGDICLLRVARRSEERAEGARYVKDMDEAVQALSWMEGKILAATGTRDLQQLCSIPDYQGRIHLRLLPSHENLKKALDLGFLPENIICMQGPFSREMNQIIMRERNIDILLTKESGERGGYREKLDAALSLGVLPLVIKRPVQEEGIFPEEVLRRLEELSGGELCFPSALKDGENSGILVSSGNDRGMDQGDDTRGEIAAEHAGDDNRGVIISEPRNSSSLRRGITTGTCCALAASAAAMAALTGRAPERCGIMTPAGIYVCAPVIQGDLGKGYARCGIRKYSGDDPDVTDGMEIWASVFLSGAFPENIDPERGFISGRISLGAGEGIGVVTRPGLGTPVGKWAINPVPRSMIFSETEAALEEAGYEGEAFVQLDIPGGRERAQRTFNPSLGIEDGLSVIGTTGIVEPMSLEAFSDSVGAWLDVLRAEGHTEVCLTPGSIGERLYAEYDEGGAPAVRIGNLFGSSIDMACSKGFDSIILAGHAGKLVKLAAGVMNTHSSMADCRMEVLASHAAALGAPADLASRILECISTAAAEELLRSEGLFDEVMQRVVSCALRHVRARMDRAGFLQVKARIIIFAEEGVWSAS